MNNLIELYKAWDKPEKTDKWRADLTGDQATESRQQATEDRRLTSDLRICPRGPVVMYQSRSHVVAEFEHFRVDQPSVIFHAHPNCLIMRAGLKRDVVVLLQSLVHNNRQIVQVAERRLGTELAILEDFPDLLFRC